MLRERLGPTDIDRLELFMAGHIAGAWAPLDTGIDELPRRWQRFVNNLAGGRCFRDERDRITIEYYARLAGRDSLAMATSLLSDAGKVELGSIIDPLDQCFREYTQRLDEPLTSLSFRDNWWWWHAPRPCNPSTDSPGC
jgi:hypothetical protein